MSNLKLRAPVPFPASVTGSGGIAVQKANGVWVIYPDFSQLASLAASAVSDPSLKSIWIYDPIANSYAVLTLGGLGDALFKLTSTSSVAIGSGSKVFTVQSNKDVGVGSWVIVTDDAAPSTNWMIGQITAYSGTTLTINVPNANNYGGSGTKTSWTIRVSAPAGATGATGPTGPGYSASSVSSQTIGNSGTKTFTVASGLAYTVGARVRASDAASPATNWMEGVVTSYSSTTLVFTADKSAGSGTLTSWNINLAGQPGTGDLLSTNNLSDVASAKTAFDNLSVHGADIVASATLNLDSATGYVVDVTGNTGITAITLADGKQRWVRFTGTPQITNGASLVLPGGANITMAAGDYAKFIGYSAGVVRMAMIIRAAGRPLNSGITDTLAVGYITTSSGQGTKSSGTFTPDPTARNIQDYTNGGAHTLAPPSQVCTLIVDIVNNASAGAITTSGFTAVDGDSFDTTNGSKFRCYISVGANGSHLNRKKMA